MYTRCPECDTVFSIDREQLEAAGGDVRCGRCSGIFDARDGLSETLAGLEAARRSAPDDREPAAPDEADPAALDDDDTLPPDRTLDDPAADDKVLEFNMADERWEEVFIDDELDEANTRTIPAPPRSPAASAPDPSTGAPAGSGVPIHAGADEAPSAGSAGILVEESDESEIELYFGSTFPGDAGEAALAGGPGGTRRTDATEEPAGTEEVPFILAPPAQAPVRLRTRILWAAASILLLVGVLAQLVHLNRHEWATLPWAGEHIARTYRALGRTLHPQWDVDQYRVTAAAAAVESQGQGRLRIHAELENTAERPQPYPLIRVTLTDRWGDAISERLLEPGEYVREGTLPETLLDSGEPIAADIVVVDPGEDAFGFEIAVCLRDAQRRVECADLD